MLILNRICTASALQNVSEKEKGKLISWRKPTRIAVHVATKEVLKQPPTEHGILENVITARLCSLPHTFVLTHIPLPIPHPAFCSHSTRFHREHWSAGVADSHHSLT